MISNVKEAGSSQNEMLFMRGNAMSGAPIINGTIQLPNPPIIAGITMKKIMIRPCAVVKTLKVCGSWKICRPGCASSSRMPMDRMPPIRPADQREGKVHRADVLVVGRIDEAAPAGRMTVSIVVVVRAVSSCAPSCVGVSSP